MADITRQIKKRTYSKSFYVAKAIALAIFPIILLLLPADFFDRGRDVCLFTLFTGYHCLGCGMTRGCMHFIHLDFKAAWSYNHVCFVVLPILCVLLLVEYKKTYLKIRDFRKEPISDTATAKDAVSPTENR